MPCELNLLQTPFGRVCDDVRFIRLPDAVERCMSAAYKAYLLTAALKIHRSAGALSRGRAVIQTKGGEDIRGGR